MSVSQSVGRSVSQSVTKKFCEIIFFKFRSNLLEAFWVNLNAFSGFVLPNQYCVIVVWEKWGWFLVHVFSWVTPIPLWSLLYNTIVLYDVNAFHSFVITWVNYQLCCLHSV